MRRLAWFFLLLFVFTIPWEYSLEFREPWGNIARLLGVFTVLVAVATVLAEGRLRASGAMQCAVLALFLWLALSTFWSIDPAFSFAKLRGYLQEMMVVFLVWEFADRPADLRNLFRVYVAGCWVLALLSVADLAMADAASLSIRFTAQGQDPNDAARFLDLGFPFAALLFCSERTRVGRFLAIGYLPIGIVAVALSGSRSGLIAAFVALMGCGLLLVRTQIRAATFGLIALFLTGAWIVFAVPAGTLRRLATIGEQLHSGDLNQRLQIWQVGWQAFLRAPLLGRGAGTFVAAAGLAPIDTAHNTALSIAVSAGVCGLLLMSAIFVLSIVQVARLRGVLRIAFACALLIWLVTSMIATVEESRTTWLLFGLVALAARLARDDRDELAVCFDSGRPGVLDCT